VAGNERETSIAARDEHAIQKLEFFIRLGNPIPLTKQNIYTFSQTNLVRTFERTWVEKDSLLILEICYYSVNILSSTKIPIALGKGEHLIIIKSADQLPDKLVFRCFWDQTIDLV
jgi:hypothetical protein